jgi:hypothetical protein
MDTRHSNLLSELRYAIDEAFGTSERVRAAIMALERAGQGVKIAIDTTLVPATTRRSDCRGVLMLDANDMLFLRDLKISVGIRTAER